MDVRNCKLCGALFNYSDSPICPACNKKLEDKFQSVKDYIRENPRASVSQIAEDTEVPVQQLKKWVRQERLTFTSDSGVMIDCEKCGKPIQTGRFCKDCKSTLTHSFSGLYSENPQSPEKKQKGPAKMRFLGE